MDKFFEFKKQLVDIIKQQDPNFKPVHFCVYYDTHFKMTMEAHNGQGEVWLLSD